MNISEKSKPAVDGQNRASVSLNRAAWLDAARGVAILLMISYHFAWDLAYFGVGLTPQQVVTGVWQNYARFIGSSFLFLAGFTSVYAVGQKGLSVLRLGRRVGIIGGCALLISVATWFFASNQFVYFGILHCLTAASLLSFVLNRRPIWLLIAVAIILMVIPALGLFDLGSGRWLAWLGLSAYPPSALDYYPILPWLGIVVLGMVMARLIGARMAGFFAYAQPIPVLSWMGRNALVIYMLHQPVLLVVLSAFLG